jgi:hypothetical protein
MSNLYYTLKFPREAGIIPVIPAIWEIEVGGL